ncbi:hypothetical protein [Spirosoma flavum]|uniref:DUF3592 domain-containing protein n=1 Tax=Spirosoma flavum TaxID=2048557 RepID=A0ABW6AM83_9BACT
MSQREGIFRIGKKYNYLRWFVLVLLFPATVGIPFMIATDKQIYPDLNLLMICYLIASFLWMALLIEFGQKTLRIELYEDEFLVKKCWQKARHFPYQSILNYNEQPSRIEPFKELTIYLSTNWFIIRSNEFADYDYKKDQLTHYAQPDSYKKVVTLAERNRLRWAISGLALLILATITFGYLAHNPTDEKPARLKTVTDIVDQIRENRNKGNLNGFTLQLHRWPDFSFYVSRRDYTADIRSLKQTVAFRDSIILIVRESDYRKKLVGTEPLSFGDKYDNYKQIKVFGVNQGDWVHLRTDELVYEPTHTNPLQRSFLLSILLLFCWVGWVYIDRHEVLQPD